MKPARNFVGQEGHDSKDINYMGPATLANELDVIHKMFDPLLEHGNGETGGIKYENFNPELHLLRFIHISTEAPVDFEDGDHEHIWIQYTVPE